MMTDSLPATLTFLQKTVLALEIVAYLAGIGFWLWGLTRRRWRVTDGGRMQPWKASVVDFLSGASFVLLGGISAQVGMAAVTQKFMPDGDGAILLQGAGFQLGMLAGALITMLLVIGSKHTRFRPADSETEGEGNVGAAMVAGAEEPDRRPLGIGRSIFAGIAVFAMALPLMIATAAVWQQLVTALGFKITEQDLVGLLSRSSPGWAAAMVFFAVIVAPCTEELIFRGGFFRFLHRRLGTVWALVISGAVFGSVHLDLSVFGPLCVLGIFLAAAYLRTGSIVVPMVAHALVNLNTIVLVLSGFGPSSSS